MSEKYNIDEILSKYEEHVIKNIKTENFKQIISFLKDKKCDFINELLEDYLDLFCFEYNEFVQKYNILNKKYNNDLLNYIKEDMNILEEFYM